MSTVSQLGFIITYLTMYKVIFACLIVVLCSAGYSSSMGEKLCRLTVASYCRKAEVEKWECGPCKNSPYVMKNVKTF